MQIWRVVSAMALVFTISGCEDKAKVATVTEVVGEVTLRKKDQSQPTAIVASQVLKEGNIVATGADSTARVVFVSGNELTLSPESRLRIQAGGSQVTSFGAVLLSGDIKARKGGSNWAIGTPFGIVTVGGSDASLRVDETNGLQVLVGEIELIKNDGAKVLVKEGEVFSLDGLVVQINAKREFVLEPMTITLVGNIKHVTIRHKDETEFAAPQNNETISEGDSVRTDQAAGARMKVGNSGEIELAKNSEATLTTLRQGGGEETVEMDLKGGAGLRFAASKDGNRVQRVRVAGHTIEIKPGLQTSDADVEELGSGRVRVTAKAGHVMVDETTRVSPGESIELAAGQALEVKQVYAPIELHAGRDAAILYDRRIPKLAFSWPKRAEQKSYVFELSNNRKFTSLVFAEEVPGERIVYEGLGSGTYHWRVKLGDKHMVGSLSISKDVSKAAKANRVNNVDDTGESTVVYFQRAIPAITLRWKELASAANYRIKVFRDDDFDKPLVSRELKETQVTLSPSTFEEGGFLWMVSALDATGKALTTGKMNNLQIAFDNAVSELVIKTPRKSEVVRTKRLITRGEAQIGTGLSINGKAVGLDHKGRFGEALMLESGVNFVVYKVRSKDDLERYYLRDVILK